MPDKTETKEQTAVPSMDQVLDQFSEKETAKEPDSKDKEVSEEPEKTEETEEKKEKPESKEDFDKRVQAEAGKVAQSKVDKQFVSYYKERDELKKERDEALEKAEAKDYDNRLNNLFGDEDEAVDENGKPVKKSAWQSAREIVLDFKKNSRTVADAMKELDKLANQFEEKTAKNLGLIAKNPVERIHNLNRVIALLDDATKTNNSTEFYFDLRDKGLAQASDKDSIIKRLGETQSSREWDSECKAIKQELSAKTPRKPPHQPESNKSTGGGGNGLFTRQSLKDYDPRKKTPAQLNKDAEDVLNQLTKK